MNAFHVEEINLTGGPLDSDVIPVMPDQMAFYYIANDRTHTYFRIGDTRNFFYVGSRMNGPSRNGLEVAGFSTFQDHRSLMSRIASITWIHKLSSLMG